MPKAFHVSDGKLVLTLEPEGDGWYGVTAPFERGLVTQARTIEDAFEMASDAQKLLREVRADFARRFGTDPALAVDPAARSEPAEAPPRHTKKRVPSRVSVQAKPSQSRKSRALLPGRPKES